MSAGKVSASKKILRSCGGWLGISVLLGGCRGGVLPATIFLTQSIIDSMAQNSGQAIWCVAILGIVMLSDVILFRILEYVNVIVSNRIDRAGGELVLSQCASLPYSYFEDARSCEEIDRIVERYHNVYQGLVQSWSLALSLIISFTGILGYLLSVSPLILLLLIVAVAGPLLLSIFATVKEFASWETFYPFFLKSKYLAELMTKRNNVKEIRLFQYMDYMERVWEDTLQKFHSSQIASNLKPRYLTGFCVFLQYSVSIIVLFFLVPQVRGGTLTLGLFVAVAQAMWSFVGDFQYGLIQIFRCFKEERLFSQRFNSFLSSTNSPNQETFPKDGNIRPFRWIELKDVWFRYTEDSPWVLQGVSMVINRGEKVGLVGENGSGKTTLIKIITGLLQPQRGKVLLNGEKISQQNHWMLMKTASAVFQDFSHFNMTLEENLSLENPDISQNIDKMEEILHQLHPQEDFLKEMRNGFETFLGKEIEDGQDLSGGQWQTVAVARSLLSGKPLLILDEPTAALDPLSEAALCELIYQYQDEKTILISTHRLGAVVHAHRIFTMAQGKMIEAGSHTDLIRENGLYAKLFETQKSWYTHIGPGR